MTSTTLEAALSYADAGLRVLPVARGEKRPLITNWPSRATAQPDSLRSWWSQFAEPDVGIATGHGLVVIDVDPRSGGDVSHLELPPTVEAITGGGGRHLYFRHDTELRSCASALGPGVDIRAAKGFVVAPPSTHRSGQEYEWLRDVRDVAMAVLPKSIAQQLAVPGPDYARGSISDPLVPQGRRDETAVRAAGMLRSLGVCEEAIGAGLAAIAETGFEQPPEDLFTTVDARRVAHSVARHPAGRMRIDPIGHVGRARAFAAAQGRRLDPAMVVVLLELLRRMDWADGRVYVAQSRIVAVTGLSRNTVKKALAQLRELGLVELIELGGERTSESGEASYVATTWRVVDLEGRTDRPQRPDDLWSVLDPLTDHAIVADEGSR